MKNERAMYAISYGLFVLTARQGERDNGCIINTAVQVTAQPNRVTIAVNKGNLTHDMIQETGKFNLSVLSEEADFQLFKRFGFQSGRDSDKFAGTEDQVRRGENGLLYLTRGTNAWLSCRVVSHLDLGSHTLFIVEVEDAQVLSDREPLTYAYYQNVLKPKPQPQAQPERKIVGWRCKICNYVYEGETLPADFICPICGHPAEDFEPIYAD